MTITVPGGLIQLSGNAIEVDVTTTSGAMVGKDKYKIALKVTCTALIGSPFIEEIAPDSALKSVFDISGLADQPIDTVFQFPATGVSQANTALERTITICSGEVYTDGNGDRQESWNTDNVNIRVLKGKMRPYDLGLLNDANKSFVSEYITAGKFLTNLPNPVKVLPTQIVKLWYMSHFAETHNAVWHCRITADTDEGPTDFNITGECILYPTTGLIEFNINPTFMGFDNTLSTAYKRIKYLFWLEDNTGHISETREFTVDNRYHENPFFFYSVNSFSVVDCNYLSGKYSENLKTESESAYKPVPFGSGTKVSSIKTVSASGRRSWKINTGFKTVKELQDMRDFLESKQIWMINPDNPVKLIPVNIDAGDYVINDSSPDFIPNLEIKVMEAN